MLEKTLVDLLAKAGIRWNLDDKSVEPSEQDVLQMLEALVEKLKTNGKGDQISTGGLILEKQDGFYDVYCYVGSYV